MQSLFHAIRLEEFVQTNRYYTDKINVNKSAKIPDDGSGFLKIQASLSLQGDRKRNTPNPENNTYT